MANCSKLFFDFDSKITPTSSQMNSMRKSREALEEKIILKFRNELGLTVSFFTQGSGAKGMKTIIIKEDGTYDADRGVYLPKRPAQTPFRIQQMVLEAVDNHTDGGAQHRNKCIRVIYKAAYNIDFPVYSELPDNGAAFLAHKTEGWIKDDPSEMIEWFIRYKDQEGQLVRLVKYLKAWASYISKTYSIKMPSGIALTVWAARLFIQGNVREDQALSNILTALRQSVQLGVFCNSPVEPFDDLTSKLTAIQKSRFIQELESFELGAKRALSEPNQRNASMIWQKFLGSRFPYGQDVDLDRKERDLRETSKIVLGGGAKLSTVGLINSSQGVDHKTHRNHGF